MSPRPPFWKPKPSGRTSVLPFNEDRIPRNEPELQRAERFDSRSAETPGVILVRVIKAALFKDASQNSKNSSSGRCDGFSRDYNHSAPFRLLLSRVSPGRRGNGAGAVQVRRIRTDEVTHHLTGDAHVIQEAPRSCAFVLCFTISQVLCNLVLRLSSVRRSFVVLLRDSLIWDRHPRGGNRMEQKYEILEFTAI